VPTSPTHTYTGQKLEPAFPGAHPCINVKLPVSVNYPKGTVLGEITASPGTFKAYAAGNADGSQIPRAILQYGCQVDASGNITFSDTGGTVGGDHGETAKAAPAYIGGRFYTADLVGLDATALTNNPAWALNQGTVANGILDIG
jgi:hypothetical protein